jgi:hypothetical protein
LVDARTAAELADPHNQRLVEKAALGQVLQQGRKNLIGGRHQAVLEAAEVVRVRIPEELPVLMPVDAYQADARLNQPPGQE